jgi:hypothetical protein
MTTQEAIERLEPALTIDGRGRYCFDRRKVSLILRLIGIRSPLRFSAQDKVGFRTDAKGLTVEELKTSVARKRFVWSSIESLAAGEPETDNGALFQG